MPDTERRHEERKATNSAYAERLVGRGSGSFDSMTARGIRPYQKSQVEPLVRNVGSTLHLDQREEKMRAHRKFREFRRWSGRWPGVLAVAACSVVNVPRAESAVGFRPQDFQTKATFQLSVDSSKVLTPGTSKIVTESAFVTLTHGLIPGNADGLEVQFFTKPITEAARTDILENGAKEMRKSNYAALVLFLDKESRVVQVNLSYVIPGTTVGRTVASRPEELKQFSNYKFDGKRLVLQSKGIYSESGSGDGRVKLSWDVDFNLPVFDRVKK